MKYGEVIELEDDSRVYYIGALAVLDSGVVNHMHVVSLSESGASRIYCDRCGGIFKLHVTTCPKCGVEEETNLGKFILQVNKIDPTGEAETIPAGEEVQVLEKDDNGLLVQTLDKRASFYVDAEELGDTPPLFGGGWAGWDYGGGVDADFPKVEFIKKGGDNEQTD